MARMNDTSPYLERWTNAKLLRELNRIANFERFDCLDVTDPEKTMPHTGAAVREATRIYRGSWLQPIIDELARRAKVTL